MTSLEIEIHDDDWQDFEWLPRESWTEQGSTIGLHWTRIRITDPQWIMFIRLKYPWTDWWDMV